MGLIVAALVAAGSFLALFHALISVTLFTCVHADPNMALISPEMDLWIVLVCLAIAWVIGFFQKSVFAWQHVGTRFYGHEKTDQGEIRTKWLVAGFPLLPIRSYRIIYQIKEVSCSEFEYEKTFMQPVEGYFHWPQMLRTAIISYGTIAWSLGCLWLIFIGPCI